MPTAKRKPQIAVVDWKPAPASNSGAELEAKVIGAVAVVKYYLADNEADFTPAIGGPRGQGRRWNSVRCWSR